MVFDEVIRISAAHAFETIYSGKTNFRPWNNEKPCFRKVMVLDVRSIQRSDEFIYHEIISAPADLAHRNRKGFHRRAGKATLREILKHHR